MTSPPVLVVVISGSVPRRPTRVRRASWDGRVVANPRVKATDEVERFARAALRRGERRKDILVSVSRWLERRVPERFVFESRGTSRWRAGRCSFQVCTFGIDD